MNAKGLQFYLDKLNPLMITYARELRGLTKKELADHIGKTAAAVTRIEKGSLRPELDTFFSISNALSTAPAFFARDPDDFKTFDISRVHFRGQRKVSATQKKALIRDGETSVDILRYFEKQGIVLPEDSLAEYSTTVKNDYEIEALAIQVRTALGLGFGPITNLINTLESFGIIVLYLTKGESINVDAFSSVICNRHVILLCHHDSASRLLFSIAHELGHLLMHDFTDGSMGQEKEANRFASAFLMPWKTFKEECPRRWNLRAFIEMKKRWRASIGAILYRAKTLSIISEGSYVRAIQQMRENGIHINEPEEPQAESPVLFSEAIKILVKHSLTITEIETELGYSRDRLVEVLNAQQVSSNLIEYLNKKASPASMGTILAFNRAF